MYKPSSTEYIIIGAGSTGISLAVHLCLNGKKVMVIDKANGKKPPFLLNIPFGI